MAGARKGILEDRNWTCVRSGLDIPLLTFLAPETQTEMPVWLDGS